MKLYVDLHIHTALSPCGDEDMTPNNIVGMCVLNGLNAIAITDHNSARNVKAVMDAAAETDLTVVGGMEVETSEEIHVVTLFPNLESLYQMERLVYDHLPPIKNKKEIFGEQIIYDGNDEKIGEEERLLMTATSLSVSEVINLTKDLGGAAIPAHIDRDSYSIITSLGFIPPDLELKYVELSKKVNVLDFFQKNPDISEKYRYIISSDAHYLEELDVTENIINPSLCTASEIVKYLS